MAAMWQVNVPSGPVGSSGSVECEVVGSVEEIDRAVALIQDSIQQSELVRRRQALQRRQKTRKPAVRRGEEREQGREGGREGAGREGRREQVANEPLYRVLA